MKQVKKRDGYVKVRMDFKRLVLGLLALFLVAGPFGISQAAMKEAAPIAKEAGKKALTGAAEKAAKETEKVKNAVAEEAEKKAEAKSEIPEFVDINTQKMCPDMKGLKKDIKHVDHFTHAAHIEMLKKEGKGFVCATCHKGAKSKDEILKGDKCKRMEEELKAAGGPAKLKNYFHSTCLKCHKDLKKQGKETGPVSCKGCHSRKAGDK